MTLNTNTAVSTTTTSTKTDLLETLRKHLKAMGNRTALAYRIYNERRALRNISDEALTDMGLTRADLAKEINRSAFDIPENRK